MTGYPVGSEVMVKETGEIVTITDRYLDDFRIGWVYACASYDGSEIKYYHYELQRM